MGSPWIDDDLQKQSLDHYLRDQDIVRVIRRFWKGKVDKSFYTNCPEVTDAFWSAPFPVASEQLGYPVVKSEFKVGKDVVDMTQGSEPENDS